jgi:hypothetical protein
LEPSFPHENCQLSDRFYYDLDPYNDILPDRNYDRYSRNEYARSCQEKLPQRRPYVESGMYTAIPTSSWDVPVSIYLPVPYSKIVNHFRLLPLISFLSSLLKNSCSCYMFYLFLSFLLFGVLAMCTFSNCFHSFVV